MLPNCCKFVLYNTFRLYYESVISKNMRRTALLSLMILFGCQSYCKTYQVGATRTYTSPSKVMALVADGDTVAIDAGFYSGDVGAWTKDNLYIYCLNGMAHLDANGKNANGKAIWVIVGNNTTIENIEFSGATVPDHNGAGIRQEGTGLTVRHCYFHDNEDGILAGDNQNSDIIIERSEFSHNGYGDGYSHNMYINHVRSFMLKFCYTHHAKVGHNVKSRAYNSYILYNRIMDEADGTSSYLIDLPNGGNAIVLGNTMMKGPLAQNRILVNYGAEGLSNPTNELYVINNTMIADHASTTFVNVKSGTTIAKVINNIFAGAGTAIAGSADVLSNLSDPSLATFHFVDSSTYDYRIKDYVPSLRPGSLPGNAGAFSLLPTASYKHPTDSAKRTMALPDIGAFEMVGGASVKESDREFHSLTNYPNPFSERTIIRLSEATDGQLLTMVIFNECGSIVGKKQVLPHNSEIQYERGNLSAGAYHYRLLGKNEKEVGRGEFIVY